MTTTPTLDPAAIEGLRALSPDTSFLRELIEIFLQDTPERLKELEASLARGDAATATRAAHSIKGSSSNFGAQRLSKIALAIEMQGKASDLTNASANLAEIKAEYALVSAALTQIIQEN